MPDRDQRPIPDSSSPVSDAHYRVENDIDVPPIDEHRESDDGGSDSTQRQQQTGGASSLIASVVLLSAVVVGGWFMLGGSAEKEHPNWQHVAAASEASAGDLNATMRLDKSGNVEVASSLDVTKMDVDRITTRKVQAGLRNGLTEAQTAIQNAQGAGVQIVDLASNPELLAQLRNRQQEFFQVYLFDCCDEDGDVVEILLNGSLFATVPITHEGTSLSIPLQKGSNSVGMRGVRDGGGGVTVSLRSSRGDYFCRSMRVGQQYQMEVVAQ